MTLFNFEAMNEERKLPEVVTIHADVLKVSADVKNCARRIEEGHKALQMIADLGKVPTDPGDCNEAWLSSVIDKKLSEVEALPLTESDKSAAQEKWQAINNEAMAYVEAIQESLKAYPLTFIVGDDGVKVNNIDQVIEQTCKRSVPGIAQSHYDLFMKVYDSLLAFRKFEQENGIHSFPLWEMIRKARNPKDFALGWVGGGFTAKTDTLYLQQIRAVEMW